MAHPTTETTILERIRVTREISGRELNRYVARVLTVSQQLEIHPQKLAGVLADSGVRLDGDSLDIAGLVLGALTFETEPPSNGNGKRKRSR